ncbi:MAG TPA: histidine kinase, partial [Thermoanaerobaculia bacterium]|nr:histidine kinase [Thermoanaerobaculia bacterium]
MPEVVDLTADQSEERKPAKALLFAGGWTALAILEAVLMKVQLPHIDTSYAFTTKAIETYALAFLSIGVWHAAKRLHERRWSRAQRVLAHVALCVVTVVIWKGIHLTYLYLAIGPQFWALIYADSWAFQLITVLMTYGTLLGVVLAMQSAARERARERQQAALVLTTREAELALLRAQLQPHFLFNSLNSILALVDQDPQRAREMLVRLAALLQSTMRRLDLDHVSLNGEIELVRAYLDIEKVRFVSRLDVSFDVPQNAGRAGVPPLLLQPLVENAVKHALAPSPEGGSVRVAARVHDGRLIVEVGDSGGGIVDTNRGRGLGLELTRRRLDAVYGSDYTLS